MRFGRFISGRIASLRGFSRTRTIPPGPIFVPLSVLEVEYGTALQRALLPVYEICIPLRRALDVFLDGYLQSPLEERISFVESNVRYARDLSDAIRRLHAQLLVLAAEAPGVEMEACLLFARQAELAQRSLAPGELLVSWAPLASGERCTGEACCRELAAWITEANSELSVLTTVDHGDYGPLDYRALDYSASELHETDTPIDPAACITPTAA